MKTWLLDTGPLVAFLDESDEAHEAVAARLLGFSGRLATTSTIITESMHVVSRATAGPRVLAEFVAASSISVYGFCRPRELAIAATLMDTYADTPMDFGDATLVLLSQALNVREILTLDRRGFSTYRAGPSRGFHLVLDR